VACADEVQAAVESDYLRFESSAGVRHQKKREGAT